MSKIFDNDSDSDIEIKTNNDYAKNYDVWRKKEELNRREPPNLPTVPKYKNSCFFQLKRNMVKNY